MHSHADALALVLARAPSLSFHETAADFPGFDSFADILKNGMPSLASEIHADRDIPALSLSRMDGYAVVAPLKSGDVLRVVAETPAGSAPQAKLHSGDCVRLFTGSALPEGANAVLEQESVETRQSAICVLRDVKPGEYFVPRASVAKSGAALVPAGAPFGPAVAGVCAFTGRRPKLQPAPRAAILSTGEELVSFEQKPAPHQIRDSNGPSIAAALLASGFSFAGRLSAPDDLQKTVSALRDVLSRADVDALITLGAVSVGDYDLVPLALKECGAEILLHHVSIKPGKPFLFALWKNDGVEKPIFGLPGNPLSSLTTFYEFVAPALRKMAGRQKPWAPVFGMTLTDGVKADRRRDYLCLAKTHQDEDGRWFATPIHAPHSADLISAVQAQGVLHIPAARDAKAGDEIFFHPWKWL